MRRRRENIKVLSESTDQKIAEFTRLREEFKKDGGKKILKLWESLELEKIEGSQITDLKDHPPTGNVLDQIYVSFSGNQYHVERNILMQFLLSTLTAAATGSFVVLSGPTGVGKTSLVNFFAAALGAGYGVVPVRPSWIDPTDLLGFFNPQEQRYQPTPFLDYLLEAKSFSEANRLYFLTMDEMNLSRIENYGADFLSRLEKARLGESNVKLLLY